MENRLTAVKGEGGCGLGEKGEVINQNKTKQKNPHRHRQQNGNYQKEGRAGRHRRAGINGDGRRPDLGW